MNAATLETLLAELATIDAELSALGKKRYAIAGQIQSIKSECNAEILRRREESNDRAREAYKSGADHVTCECAFYRKDNDNVQVVNLLTGQVEATWTRESVRYVSGSCLGMSLSSIDQICQQLCPLMVPDRYELTWDPIGAAYALSDIDAELIQVRDRRTGERVAFWRSGQVFLLKSRYWEDLRPLLPAIDRDCRDLSRSLKRNVQTARCRFLEKWQRAEAAAAKRMRTRQHESYPGRTRRTVSCWEVTWDVVEDGKIETRAVAFARRIQALDYAVEVRKEGRAHVRVAETKRRADTLRDREDLLDDVPSRHPEIFGDLAEAS